MVCAVWMGPSTQFQLDQVRLYGDSEFNKAPASGVPAMRHNLQLRVAGSAAWEVETLGLLRKLGSVQGNSLV